MVELVDTSRFSGIDLETDGEKEEMEKELFFTYILYSESFDSFYVGYSSNIEKRLFRHNSGGVPSTGRKKPWVLKYYEKFDNKSDAIKRESQIKRMKSKKYIQDLILKKN